MSIRQVYLFIFLLFFDCNTNANLLHHTEIPTVFVKAQPKFSLTSGPISLVTRQQIVDSGANTLAQALQTFGGVQLQDTIGNNSRVIVSMRGFGANASSNTLVLINGIPITNPDLAPPDLNAIPLHEINYIQILAGSESVLYGDQAVGGVINIITQDHVEDNIHFSCAGGSFNQQNCYLTLGDDNKPLKYSISLTNDRTDNYRDHNAYNQHRYAARFTYPYFTGLLHLDYSIANEYMQYPGALTEAEVQTNRRQANNHTDFFSDNNGFLHLHHKQNLFFDWQLNTDFVFRNMNGDGVLFSPFSQVRSIYYMKPQLTGTLYHIKTQSGVDLESDRYVLNSLFGKTADTEKKIGIFTLTTIPYSDKLFFALGARGALQNSALTNTNTNSNRATATTLGLTYELISDMQFYLRRAGSFRFPKADENASTLSGRGLKTQRGNAYESGITVDHGDYSGTLGIYQLNLVDEITFDPTQTPEQPFGINRNLNPTVRTGFTLSGKKYITPNLILDGQYNYVRARFQSGLNAGHRIPLVAENIARGGIDYHFLNDFSLYIEGIYTGNQFPANDDANIGKIIGGYAIYNLHLRYQYHAFSASFRINNFFNKFYNYYTVFNPTTQTDSFYPAPGFNCMLTLHYGFSSPTTYQNSAAADVLVN